MKFEVGDRVKLTSWWDGELPKNNGMFIGMKAIVVKTMILEDGLEAYLIRFKDQIVNPPDNQMIVDDTVIEKDDEVG